MLSSRVRLFRHGKLRSKWDGPFEAIGTTSHGVITLQSNESNISKINGQCFKDYLEPKKHANKEVDVIEFVWFVNNAQT